MSRADRSISVPGRWRSWWVVTGLSALLALTLLLLMAFLVNDRATTALRAQANSAVQGTASLTTLFLHEQVRGLQRVVESYARRNAVREAVQQPGGPDRQELDRQMQELWELRADVLNAAGVASAEGIILAAPQAPSVVGRDLSARDWFQGVTRTREPYVSKAFTTAAGDTPLVVSIAVPVVDQTGRLIAVVNVSYKISAFQEYVSQFAALRGERITVTDRDGVVIARPHAAPTTVESRRGDARIAAALAGRSGVGDPGQRDADTHMVAAYAPVPEVGWAVLVELPTERAYVAVERLRTEVLVVTLPLALLLLLGALLLALTLRSRDANRSEVQRQAAISRAVLDATTDAMLLVDLAGRPVLRNAGARRLGDVVEPPEVVDVYSEAARLTPIVTDSEAFDAVARAMRTDPELKVDHEFTIEQTQRSFRLLSAPVRGVDGAPLGRLITARETTQERRARRAAQLTRDAEVSEQIEARERTALAEAVHDDSLQFVVAALLRIDSLQSRVPVAEAETLEQIATLLERAIEHLRQLIAASSAPDLSAGLGPALDRVAEGIFTGTSTTVTVTGPASPPLSRSAAEAAFRILREALLNARRHAQAAHVAIGTFVADDRVVLTVRDDGVGSAAYSPAPGHLGVGTMHRRAEAEAADLAISGSPGHGTAVVLTLYIGRDDA